MNYSTTHLWTRGERITNEDSLAIMSITINHRQYLFAVVADGIGGLNDGENASCYVTSRLKTCFEDSTRQMHRITMRRLRTILRKELYCCHQTLLTYSELHKYRTGTTCSIVCMCNRHGFILHVGDSRIYRLRRQRLRQYTTDQQDSRHRLIRCIGCGTFHRIDAFHIHLFRHDSILLCTDGFYRPGSTDNKTAILISQERNITSDILTDIESHYFS